MRRRRELQPTTTCRKCRQAFHANTGKKQVCDACRKKEVSRKKWARKPKTVPASWEDDLWPARGASAAHWKLPAVWEEQICRICQRTYMRRCQSNSSSYCPTCQADVNRRQERLVSAVDKIRPFQQQLWSGQREGSISHPANGEHAVRTATEFTYPACAEVFQPINRRRLRRSLLCDACFARYEAGRRHATYIVNQAIKSGELTRPARCELCGAVPAPSRDGRSAIVGHHAYRYDRPKELWWLCRSCNSWLAGYIFHCNRLTREQFLNYIEGDENAFGL